MMDKRDIADRSLPIVKLKCPFGWILRSQEDQNDIGIDCEIEILSNGKSSGTLIKGQIKGSQRFRTVGDSLYSPPIKLERLKYYTRMLRLPVVLFLVDVAEERVWWRVLSEDQEIVKMIEEAEKRSQKSLSIPIPKGSELNHNGEALLTDVIVAIDKLRLREFNLLSSGSLYTLAQDTDQIPKTMLAIRQHHDHFRFTLMESQILAGQLETVRRTAADLAASPSETPFSRVLSLFYHRRAHHDMLPKDDPTIVQKIAREHFDTACQMLRIVRPHRQMTGLRTFVLIEVQAAKAFVVIERLLINAPQYPFAKQSAKELEGLLSVTLELRTAIRAIGKMQALFTRLVELGELGLVGNAYVSMIQPLHQIILSLPGLGLPSVATKLRDWLDNLGSGLRDLYEKSEMWTHYSMTLPPYVMLSNIPDVNECDERLGQALFWADKIQDNAVQDDIREDLLGLGRHQEQMQTLHRLFHK
jgi:hypothetical protein